MGDGGGMAVYAAAGMHSAASAGSGRGSSSPSSVSMMLRRGSGSGANRIRLGGFCIVGVFALLWLALV
jgi:hypothetical protein